MRYEAMQYGERRRPAAERAYQAAVAHGLINTKDQR